MYRGITRIASCIERAAKHGGRILMLASTVIVRGRTQGWHRYLCCNWIAMLCEKNFPALAASVAVEASNVAMYVTHPISYWLATDRNLIFDWKAYP
jgi:hypothetical protein